VVPTREIPYLHPGVAGRIERADGTVLGEIGELHPETRLALGIDAPVFGFALDLSVISAPQPAQMRAIPRYPAASRDISLLIAEEIPAARVEALIAAVEQPLVERVRILEDYRDAKLPPGHKSTLWSITYRSLERTLTDAEVDSAHEAIVARLVAELGAQRR
jgi:phenylalanyl-tRNA synthetase beta chain